jgi:hypothetical protein
VISGRAESTKTDYEDSKLLKAALGRMPRGARPGTEVSNFDAGIEDTIA